MKIFKTSENVQKLICSPENSPKCLKWVTIPKMNPKCSLKLTQQILTKVKKYPENSSKWPKNILNDPPANENFPTKNT